MNIFQEVKAYEFDRNVFRSGDFLTYGIKKGEKYWIRNAILNRLSKDELTVTLQNGNSEIINVSEVVSGKIKIYGISSGLNNLLGSDNID